MDLLNSIVVMLPLLVCSFWAVVLLVDWQRQSGCAACGHLCLWAAAAAVLYGCHVVFFSRSMNWVVGADMVYVAVNLAVFPLYLDYLSRLTRGSSLLRSERTLFLPPVLIGLLVATLYVLMDVAERQQFVYTYLYNNSFSGLSGLMLMQAWLHHAAKLIFALGVFVVLIKGRHMVADYHRMVDNLYADTEEKSLHGISTLFMLVVAVSLASLIANVVGRHVFVGSHLLALPSLLFSALLFALAYMGSRQQFGYDNIAESEKLSVLETDENVQCQMRSDDGLDGQNSDAGESKAECCSGVDSSNKEYQRKQLLANEFEQLMTDEQLYLMPGLKVADVAVKLNTNVRYVQQATNEILGVSFAEYVNRRRIDYAKQIMKTSPDLSAVEVALRSGFSSSSSYYSNLKRYGGGKKNKG